MAQKNRAFRLEFKESVAKRIPNGESVSALHQELQIKRSILYRWRDAYQKEGVAGWAVSGTGYQTPQLGCPPPSPDLSTSSAPHNEDDTNTPENPAPPQ